MSVARQVRATLVRGFVFGALAFSLVSGITADHTSAAKYVAINCNALYANALWAGDQYLAADRRGDTASANFWWSVYNSLELSYARNCMGDTAT